MKLKIMPHLFLVKINKQEQKDFKEKVGKNSPFFMPGSAIHNSRNMEHGEIVQIGEDMKDIYGWEGCQVGNILIFHHNIESPINNKDKAAQFFVYEDEVYNYYAVNLDNVRGFYDGNKITPHPNFVFLKNVPAFPNSDTIDENTGQKVRQTESGLFLVTAWNDSPQDLAQRSEKLKQRIESLTKMKRTPEIQTQLEGLEAERNLLNRKAQKHEFLPYKVAASNKRVDRNFGRKVLEDEILYCYNKECLYISNFQLHDYSYIICRVEGVGALLIKN